MSTGPQHIRGNSSGGQSLMLDISKGKVPGHRMVYVNSYANDITSTKKLIWPFTSQYVISDTPSTFYLTSTNAVDSQAVLIEWLDNDRVEQTSIITLTGQTPVLFAVGIGARINKMRTIGASNTAGTVYVSRASGHTGGTPNVSSNIVCGYEATTQTSRLAFYSVPAGHTLFGVSGYFSAPKGRDNDFLWNARNPFIGIPATETNVISLYESTAEINFAMTPAPEKTDAYFTANTEQASGRVSCRIVGILVDNNYL